ncbi:sulfotransferase [Kordiimonas sp.]|uniref:sulfotransferase n=1 Tax=Kordiimonas sp. TaxID=1970157 RepID=UPI003A933A89
MAEKRAVRVSNPIIILGVHRSGTSLLTRMLERLGVFVGKDLEQNHESMTMMAINTKFLDSKGATWDQPAYADEEDVKENIVRRLLEKNFSNIWQRFGPMQGVWGFKDPRTVCTLPLWLDVFPKAKVLYIRRSPYDIAKSLNTRFKKLQEEGKIPQAEEYHHGFIKNTHRCVEFDACLALALEQADAIDRWKRENKLGDCLELGYEELLRDPAYQLIRVCKFLSLEPSAELLRDAADLVRSDARLEPSVVLPGYLA